MLSVLGVLVLAVALFIIEVVVRNAKEFYEAQQRAKADEVEEGYQRNPEKGEEEERKRSQRVRGERTPMPPRGDKRREDFEKWYAANVR